MQNNVSRRYWGIGLTIAILTAIVYYFGDIVSWLIIAWVISLLGSPIMKALGKIKIGKWQLSSSVRAVMVIFLFYLILGLFFYIFVPVIVQQGRNLAGVNYAVMAQKLEQPIAHAEQWLIDHGLMVGKKKTPKDSLKVDTPITRIDTPATIPTIEITPIGHSDPVYSSTTIHIDSILRAQGDTVTQTNINFNIKVWTPTPTTSLEEAHEDTTAVVRPHDSPLEKLQKQVISMFNPSRISTVLSTVVAWLGNLMVLLASVTFIAFFFLKDEQLFGKGIKAAIPDEQLPKVDAALAKIRRLLTRYFGGILLQMTLITIYLTVFLSLSGVQNALLIAFFAALMNVIPYVGPIIGGVFGLLITLSTNLDADFYVVTVPLLIKVAIGFATMQALDNFIFQPVIFSNSVMAHPLEIFLVVIMGANLGGVTGMVLAVPGYTILRVIAASFLSEFKIVQQLTETIKTPDDDDHLKHQPPPGGDGQP